MSHETVIAQNIVEQAKKQGTVKEISLEIGELAHVPGHELVECLKRLVDWNINWTELKSKVKCTCGFTGHPTVLERGHDFFMIECPECKEVPDVIEGTDINLVTVKL